MNLVLNTLSMKAGDTLTIRIEGSVENSITIEVDEKGECTVGGPLNVNSRKFKCVTGGWRELPEQRKTARR